MKPVDVISVKIVNQPELLNDTDETNQKNPEWWPDCETIEDPKFWA